MIKTISCNYWKNGKCKFMNMPEDCLFSHGEKDIIDIIKKNS